jgi:hypothetical protein
LAGLTTVADVVEKRQMSEIHRPQQTIADIVLSTEKRQSSDFGKTFTPLLYNIWNAQGL